MPAGWSDEVAAELQLEEEMLGESAGRSRKAPVTGRRRFSEEERAQLTHLEDDPQSWPDSALHPSQPTTSEVITVMIVCGFVLTFLAGIGIGAGMF